ncbi:hypothetical protein BESB_004030 [Besnoitia besnoiti]|uniref:Transmembrane protein n=1 Tax=Besnoitia besnoiti TaxID=94643 RepID=A0A2A9MQ52_BESBE|nr:hypothetical protein BESB_004030 [Besnoitia besnoiti]PFH38062.1 hypothetical protein BESB_004030 [Besnoitia besnoiti]
MMKFRTVFVGLAAVALVCVCVARAAGLPGGDAAPEKEAALQDSAVREFVGANVEEDSSPKTNSLRNYPGQSVKEVLKHSAPKLALATLLAALGFFALSRKSPRPSDPEGIQLNARMNFLFSLLAAPAVGLGVYVGSEMQRARRNRRAWDSMMAAEFQRRPRRTPSAAQEAAAEAETGTN